MKILVFLTIILLSNSLASIGKITIFKGSVSIEREDAKIRAKLNLPLEKKDRISTKENSNVTITLKDDTIITIGKNSELNIEDYFYDQYNLKNSKTDFNFVKGAFRTITGQISKINPEKFKLNTNNGSLGIRGTVILGNQKLIACTKGSISVRAKGKEVILNAGEFTYTQKGKKPGEPQKLTKEIIDMLMSELSLTSNKERETIKAAAEKAAEDEKNKREISGVSHEGGGHGH